ncbi:hypothetical protein G6F56_010103 [Rhizopus delemar]|uniref:ABC transporter domain-containing protein n=1 Tax=Rhizopus stolonifer TaxID=4846 RepID=A0A367KR07_RHIST|nr:hypothetical protein G6F56_010103 [Rhizopus delemar]RCI04633.1 hypothetical protein CU098_006918 [Rhizopus stolonifer]
MPLFEAHNISMKISEGRWLFKDISFNLEKGNILVLRGPSGCGKTTLLKCLAELVPYNQGHSKLNDKDVDQYTVPIWRSRVLYVPQRPSVHPGSPFDFFNLVKSYASQKNKELGDPVKIGSEWNLSESHFSEKWSNLSGGEMQRVTLAMAVAFNPDILLLDEPTSALDPESIELVEKTLKGKTCVWITHDPKQQERVGTNTLTLSKPSSSSSSYSSNDTVRLDM